MKNRIKSLIVCGLFSFVSFSGLYAQQEGMKSEPDPALKARVAQSYGKLPISFVENHGQMDTTVRFYVSGASGTMYFTKDAVVMEFVKREKPPEPPPQEPDTTVAPIPPGKLGKERPSFASSTTPVKETRLVLKKRFIGTNPNCEVVGEEELPGKVNILRGSDSSKWKQNIATYRQIRYKNLYPGIDAVYQGSEGKLEYDLHIAPGKKAGQIKFTFEGADKVELTESGDLAIETKLGAFTEKKPNAYQEQEGKKTSIISKFILEKKNTIRFEIGKYDKKLPLIIE
ncbi:MAG: hypothetical protein QME64_09305 [bacterium]|nr:hypothetical protein [bacterium]